MATLKRLHESLADRFKKREANVAKQKLERERENDHIGNELANHDINAKFHPHVDSGDVEGTLKTKITVPIEHQDKANEVIKKLGFQKTHHVSSDTTAGGRFERRPGETGGVRWTGD